MSQSVSIQDTLKLLVELKRYSAVKDVLVTMNPSDIASVFDGLGEDVLPVMFRLLPRELAADTFAEMETHNQEVLIRGFSDTELRQVLDELYTDDAADIAEEMPANVVSRILSQASPDMRESINQILRYPDDSAGTVMTTEFVELSPDMTVSQAFEKIRDVGVDKETIYTCYVTQNGVLVGIVSAKDLMICKDPGTRISSIMEEKVISVNTMSDREEVARLFGKYNLLAMPVVDADSRLAGIITVDDVMDVIEEEATEDITIMSGQTPYEKTYRDSSSWDLYVHRIPWLLVLMVSATFTGMIITGYSGVLSAQIILAAFIPMLMDTGGNSGSQSSVTVMRALSLGEIQFSDLPKIIAKEAGTAVLCGITLSAVCFGKIMLIDRLLMNNTDVTAGVALTVSLTLAITVLAAKIIGCSLPVIAKKLGFDPAMMASPFITTIVDAVSLLVYLGVASAVLF